MSSIQDKKSQIIDVMGARYSGIVFSTLPEKRDAEEHNKNILTRSLAAFAIEKLCDVDPVSAANAVIDGGDDNGIDAYYHDEERKELWLIQSKLNNAPDMGENKKFCDGIRDLIARRFDRFSWIDDEVTPDIELALDTAGLVIYGVHIHLGANNLAQHAISDLELLKEELNKFGERFGWKEIDINRAHEFIVSENAVQSANVSLILKKWHGFTDHSNATYYGFVSAKDLADLYLNHGKALFERNIRHYMGGKSVNSSISHTVYENPTDLFYLNNGITAVCSKIRPVAGYTHDEARFELEGFNIVNGAQTVGSIQESRHEYGNISDNARVLITLIEINEERHDFGAHITRARNTQNEVKSLFFVALDPEQERLRREMKISGVVYHYRPSSEIYPDEITVEQACIALAAFFGNIDAVVSAKKELGQLFDQSGRYYSSLFNRNLTGVKLIRCVKIFNYASNILLQSERGEQTTNRRLFYRHGRLFILHIFAKKNRNIIDVASTDLSAQEESEISRIVLEMAEFIFGEAEAMFNRQKGYLSIFRNIGDSRPLFARVMARLAEIAAANQPAIVN